MVSDVSAVKEDACQLVLMTLYCKCWQSLGSVRLEGELSLFSTIRKQTTVSEEQFWLHRVWTRCERLQREGRGRDLNK